jgi:hypothetical protein
MAKEAPKIRQKPFNFVEIQESKPKAGEQLLGSSKIIKSVLDQTKYLEHKQSKRDFTDLFKIEWITN